MSKTELLDAYIEEAKTSMKFESDWIEAVVKRKLKDPNFKSTAKDLCCLCDKPLEGYISSEHPDYIRSLENLEKGQAKPNCIVRNHHHFTP